MAIPIYTVLSYCVIQFIHVHIFCLGTSVAVHSQDSIRTCKPHAVLAVHCNYYARVTVFHTEGGTLGFTCTCTYKNNNKCKYTCTHMYTHVPFPTVVRGSPVKCAYSCLPWIGSRSTELSSVISTEARWGRVACSLPNCAASKFSHFQIR